MDTSKRCCGWTTFPLSGRLFTLAEGGFLVGPAGLADACGVGCGAATDFSFTSPAFFDPASWILSANSFIYRRKKKKKHTHKIRKEGECLSRRGERGINRERKGERQRQKERVRGKESEEKESSRVGVCLMCCQEQPQRAGAHKPPQRSNRGRLRS